MLLPATGLIIEQQDRLLTVLAATIGPYVRGAGGFLVLFLQYLNRGFAAMDDGLGPEAQLKRVADAMQMAVCG